MTKKDQIYNALVNRVPGIKDRYQKKRDKAKGIKDKLFSWMYLLGLNIAFYILRNKKLKESILYPYYEDKLLYCKDSESTLSKRETPEEFAEKLKVFDIISFDVFDTLIFRPFSSPTDLFYVIGHNLKYPDYKRIRIAAEKQARRNKYKTTKSYEVNLHEICKVLEDETGINAEEVYKIEVDTEKFFCFANPYMKQVVTDLKKAGKKIIITSDMYLNSRKIEEILLINGYPEMDGYYVSCDYGKSKNQGDLYEIVKLCEGQNLKYAHIGDNLLSDIKQAEKQGFKAFYYPNVNNTGNQYRSFDMSVITGGIYRGLVNSHIHNGLKTYPREYEYGYIYGGLFVTGYCQFIHDYIHRNEIDKILFLSRDGEILLKAYQIMYPEDKNCEYVYWSRLAALKITACRFKYDYFRRFLLHKKNQSYTIKSIFLSMEIEDMLNELQKAVGISENEILNDSNIGVIRSFLKERWAQVLQHYENQIQAGKLYYSEVLEECKKAVAVDIGWAGSGAIALNYAVKHIWCLQCNIIGMIAGTNSCHNSEPDISETYLQSGELVSYMYSQRENRDLWKLHDAGKEHNLYWELLVDSPTGSFKGFYLNDNEECECRFKDPITDKYKIEEIHKGILDFVMDYMEYAEKLSGLDLICGRDAYAPMINIENRKNRKLMKSIADLMDDMNV